MGPDRGRPGADGGRSRDIGQRRLVAPGHPVPGLDLLRQHGELFQQNRGLQGVQPAVHAEADVVVFAAPLAVGANRAELGRLVLVVEQDGAAVAVAAQRLGRVEARRGVVRQGTHAPPVQAGPEALRGVRHQRQAVAPGHGNQALVVGGLAEQIDRDHRARPQAAALRLLDGRFQALRVDVVAVRQHVDEDRARAQQHDRLGRGGKGEGRHEDRVARADPLQHQGQIQRVGPVGAGHRAPRAAERREPRLQLRHLGTEDEATVGQDALDGVGQPVAEAAALRLQVDERDRASHGAPPAGRTGPRARALGRTGARGRASSFVGFRPRLPEPDYALTMRSRKVSTKRVALRVSTTRRLCATRSAQSTWSWSVHSSAAS